MEVGTRSPSAAKPLEERDTYGKAFIQVGNLWEKSELARQFSFSKRMARIAAELMDVSEGTVRKQLARGRDHLRRILDAH